MTITTQFAVSRDGLSWWRPDRRPMIPLRPLGDYGGGLQWPMRTLTQDQDADALHLFFSGTEGLHADVFSTRAAEDLAATKELPGWEYSSRVAHLGPTTTYMADGADCSSEPGSAFLDCEQPYNILRSGIPFHGAMMRATWSDGRLWALVPASGGGVEGTATTKSFAVGGRLQLSLNFVAPRRGALRVAVQAPNGSAIAGFGRDDCVPLTTNGTAAAVEWRGGPVLPRDVRSVRLVFFLRRARLYGFRVSSSQHQRAKMDDDSSLGLRLHRQRNHSRGQPADLAPAISSNDPAGQCLKYLAVDGAGALEGYSEGPDTDDWTNLAFLAPDSGGEIPLGEVYRNLHYGKSTMLNLHGSSINACLVGLASAHSGVGRQRPDCVARWRAVWLGNETHPGLWTAEFGGQWLASEQKLIGVYLGDELLSLGMTVSNLTAIVGIVKATWPEGVVYTNFARAPLIDPEWRDSSGEPFGTLGEQWRALTWFSYSSYQLNNQSWLQPEAEHRQLLYPSMAPHQRVLLQAGGWGSTSGPRGGWRQFTANCSDPTVAPSCTTDPFSCLNSAVAPAPSSAEGGLQYEVDMLLSKIGGRPCWTLDQYDVFNVEQADAISSWAARDARVIGIVVWPWAEWLDVNYYPGTNAGLKTMPRAVAAWKEIGRRILSAPEPPHSCRAPSSPPSPYPPPPPPTARQVVRPGLRFITNFDSNASAQAGWTSFVVGCGPPAANDPCAQNSYRNSHLMKCHLKGLQEAAVTKQTLNVSTMFSFQSLWGDFVPINHTGKDGKRDPIGVGTLSTDAAHSIDDFLVSLQPFVANGTITGIFIGDERTCEAGYQTHPWAFDIYINHTTSRIRALLGNRPLVYVNDCFTGWPEIPDGVDLVGIDGYSPGTNGSAEVAVVHNLLAPLWPMLKPWQGAMVVPGMIGCSPSSTIGANQSFELQQEHLLQKLDGYMAWASTEPRIAGFTMWHYNNYATNPDCGQVVCPGPERGCDWRWGASNFPKVVAKLHQIGQSILSHPGDAQQARARAKIDDEKSGVRFSLSIDTSAGMALPIANFSVRHTSALAVAGRFFIYADIVPDSDPYFPDSYSSQVGVFSSSNSTGPWTYHGICLPRGRGWDAGGTATPSATLLTDGRILLAYTAEPLPGGKGPRGIALATSNSPLGPFTKLQRPAADCGVHGAVPGWESLNLSAGAADCDDSMLLPAAGGFLLYHSVKSVLCLPPTNATHCIRALRSSDGRTWERTATTVLSLDGTMETMAAARVDGRVILITDSPGHPSKGVLEVWVSDENDPSKFARAVPPTLGDLIPSTIPTSPGAACGPQVTFVSDSLGKVVALGIDRFSDPACICCHQCRRLHVSARKCGVNQCPSDFARRCPFSHVIYPVTHVGTGHAASSVPSKTDDGVFQDPSRGCPSAWVAACPDLPCKPLPGTPPAREVIAFRAGSEISGCNQSCLQRSWRNYNYSSFTTLIVENHEPDASLTQLGCLAHRNGVRVVLCNSNYFPHFNTSRLTDAGYREDWVSAGVSNVKASKHPWVDAINIDLEGLWLPAVHTEYMTSMICSLHAQLQAMGKRLHSQDTASWGSTGPWGRVFNVAALAECVDFLLPMAYCIPKSTSVAGPTAPLDLIKEQLRAGYLSGEVQPSQIILGLPFFGYSEFSHDNPLSPTHRRPTMRFLLWTLPVSQRLSAPTHALLAFRATTSASLRTRHISRRLTL